MVRRHRFHRQRGVTLVELMVALVIGLFITLAAAGALVVARQGFTAVDSGGQLRENARFTADLMQRIVVQAGFEDVANGSYDRQQVNANPLDDPKWPGLLGYDNAWYAGGDPAALASDSRPGGCGTADSACVNGSDVLIVRFQGTSKPDGTPDGAMINCAGVGEPASAVAGARAWAVFHIVRTADNEPSLACSYYDSVALAWKMQTLVKGVEDFQVLYGTDGVTAAAAPPASANGMDGTVDSYLTAKELTGPTAQATQDNWRRVRSVRIALLFRGDAGSMATRETRTFPMRNATGTTFTKASTDAVGDTFNAPADGRLRQSMIFTVHLRNQQGYDVCTSPSSPC